MLNWPAPVSFVIPINYDEMAMLWCIRTSSYGYIWQFNVIYHGIDYVYHSYGSPINILANSDTLRLYGPCLHQHCIRYWLVTCLVSDQNMNIYPLVVDLYNKFPPYFNRNALPFLCEMHLKLLFALGCHTVGAWDPFKKAAHEVMI